MNSKREPAQACVQSRPSNDRLPPQAEPIQLTGVWRMRDTQQADAVLGGKEPGFAYRRDGHPNAASLAELLRELHQADKCVITAQGMSALAAVALSLLKPSDHVLLGQPLYGRSHLLFAQEMTRWGVTAQSISACDLDAWSAALALKPRLAIVETITNPRMSVPDLRAISERCKGSGTLLLVDNTFATPVLCQPLVWGADLVMESLSKFVCGHSDAMLGMLCGKADAWDRIESTVSTYGLASSPLDCWLTRRGLTTLPLRMERASKNAMQLAQALMDHPRVALVDYPGLPTHPHHRTAEAQFGGSFGNMLTVHLKLESAVNHSTRLADQWIQRLDPDIPFCPSLGETQTTLSHPVSTSHRSLSAIQQKELGISNETVRISCGIEEGEWLCRRLIEALDALD